MIWCLSSFSAKEKWSFQDQNSLSKSLKKCRYILSVTVMIGQWSQYSYELCVDISYHVQVAASLQGDTALAISQSIKDMFD